MFDSMVFSGVSNEVVPVPSVGNGNPNNSARNIPAVAGFGQGLSFQGVYSGTDFPGRLSAGTLAILIVGLSLFYLVTRNAQGGG